MPLYLAAPMSWYKAVMGQPVVTLINDARFPKQTLRQRCSFMTVEGPRVFSVPLVKSSRGLPYRQVEISYQSHWQNELIHALQTSYGKAPFFEYYDYRFEAIIRHKHRYLWDLNHMLLEETLKCLRMDVKLEILHAEAYIPDPPLITDEKPYYQVFADKTGFFPGMSVLDLIFNEGVNAFHVLSGM